MPAKKPRKLKRILIAVILVLCLFLVLGGGAILVLYRTVLRSNTNLGERSSVVILIPTGATFTTVMDTLDRHRSLKDRRTFEWMARRQGYDQRVRPGRYRIREGMSNRELVNLLSSGRQEPVRLVITSARNAAELAGKVSRVIEADSLSLLNSMRDAAFLEKFGTGPSGIFTLTIPNTYEFYWNTSARGFLTRMAGEASRFWEGPRQRQADSLGLTLQEVVTLAAIVEKETAMNSEKARIAGVYINRLKRKMPLQADPTLIYAWNDYSIRRVLNRHKEIRSPYNTYLNPGLPPGPICLPSIASIDAVLFYTRHNYLYFCARDDFSGYHNFAETLSEHNRNAVRYQQALQRARVR